MRREVAIVCYNCKQKGHIAARCPSKASLYCDSDGIGEEASRSSDVYRSENVNGVPVEDILLDNGATRTLVREDLVPTRSRVDGKVTIRCAHGDSVTYPLVETHIRVAGRELTLTAAVSKTLPAALLLGRDAPELLTLLGNREEKGTTDPVGMDHVLAVTTRAQAAQRKQEGERITEREIIKESQALTPVKSSQWIRNARVGKTHTAPTPRKIPANQVSLTLMILYSHEDARSIGSQEARKDRTVNLRRAEQAQATMRELDFSADKLKELQRTDSTLEAVRKSARGLGEPSTARPGFFQRDGILYRRYVPRTGDTEHGVIEQLVLPTPCRKAVLSVAHSIPLAGYMGKNKTALRILQRFYWPSVFRDVAEYCKSCPRCQKSAPRRAPQASLVELYLYLLLRSPSVALQWAS